MAKNRQKNDVREKRNPMPATSAFNVHDVVESLVDAQGLERGKRYRVVGMSKHHNVTGTYVSYTLVKLGGTRMELVSNGALVLKLVEEAS